MTFRDIAMTYYTNLVFPFTVISFTEYYLTVFFLDADNSFDNL